MLQVILGIIGYIGFSLLIARFFGINGKYDEQCQRCGSEDIVYSDGYIRCAECGAVHVVVLSKEPIVV